VIADGPRRLDAANDTFLQDIRRKYLPDRSSTPRQTLTKAVDRTGGNPHSSATKKNRQRRQGRRRWRGRKICSGTCWLSTVQASLQVRQLRPSWRILARG